MSTKTETLHQEGFILREESPDITREIVTVYQGTAGVRVGTLAAKITSAGAGFGEYANYDPTASNGLQTLLGVWCDSYVGATPAIGTAPGKGVILARGPAAVNSDRLDWNGQTLAQINTSIASLKSLGIIPRDGV
jgi:hypothetical protein